MNIDVVGTVTSRLGDNAGLWECCQIFMNIDIVGTVTSRLVDDTGLWEGGPVTGPLCGSRITINGLTIDDGVGDSVT